MLNTVTGSNVLIRLRRYENNNNNNNNNDNNSDNKNNNNNKKKKKKKKKRGFPDIILSLILRLCHQMELLQEYFYSSLLRTNDTLSRGTTLSKLLFLLSEKGSTLRRKNLLPLKRNRKSQKFARTSCEGKRSGSRKLCLPWKKGEQSSIPTYQIPLTHLCQVDSSTITLGTGPSLVEGVSG